MNYTGIYTGLVEDNRDPEKLGRLKVRVPIAYGTPSEISTAQIPWALSRGLPAGGSNKSGGIDWVPEVGDQVWVTFLDSDADKPLWEWATQSRPQSKNLPLHQYGVDGRPSRMALTKYGHTVEMTSSSVLLTTLKGNVILLDDGSNGVYIKSNEGLMISAQDALAMVDSLRVSASGSISFETQNGFSVQATDLAIRLDEDLIQMVGRYSLLVGSALFTIIDGTVALVDGGGTTLAMDGAGNASLTTSGGTYISLSSKNLTIKTPDLSSIIVGENGVQVSAQNVLINGGNIALGREAYSPVVLTDPLVTLFNSHTHSNGNNGSPTGPPIVPILSEFIGSKTTLAK